MNSPLLETLLRSRGVPQSMYKIGGSANEAYCLVSDEMGWLVYYSERGNMVDLRRHIREDEACEDLMNRVLRQVERDGNW